MNHRIPLVVVLGVLALGVSACSDSTTDSPSEGTTSDMVMGGTVAGGPSSVLNNNGANPQAPQNPTGPSGTQP